MILSHFSIDHTPQTIVPVIVSYDTSGNIVPLYIRIQGTAFKVLGSKLVNEGPYSQNIHLYDCRITDGTICQSARIIYHKREDLWTIQPK